MRRLEVAENWWLEIEAEQQRIKDQMSREQGTVPNSKESRSDKPGVAWDERTPQMSMTLVKKSQKESDIGLIFDPESGPRPIPVFPEKR